MKVIELQKKDKSQFYFHEIRSHENDFYSYVYFITILEF